RLARAIGIQGNGHPSAARKVDGFERAGPHAANDNRIPDASITDVTESRHHLRAPFTDVGLFHPQRRTGERQNHQQHDRADDKIVGALHRWLPSNHVTAQNASSTRIITAEYTTAVVAARPTPSAPPAARRPRMQQRASPCTQSWPT